MIEDKVVIALIPARGGSKGIPRKNLVDLGGKPLIRWTIEAAKSSPHIDRIYCSSEDDFILDEAIKSGIDVIRRPVELSGDYSTSEEVVLHFFKSIEDSISSDYIFILLQPTSPFRNSIHITNALEKFNKSACNFLISVTQSIQNAHNMYIQSTQDSLIKIIDSNTYGSRRQDLPVTYYSNGGIFITTKYHFRKVKSFKPKTVVGFEIAYPGSIDIDDFNDLELAREVCKKLFR